MTALADAPELIGFFSYSRDDDLDSGNALSQLRTRIQNELRAQLGRSRDSLRIWQDAEAIPAGTFWANEIDVAVAQASFFIPIITPRVVVSQYCGIEFEKFLAREHALDRADLVFPILYIDVDELHDERQQLSRPVLRAIAERQYADWREYRYDPDSPAFRRALAQFCGTIAKALRKRTDRPASPRSAPAVLPTDGERPSAYGPSARQDETAGDRPPRRPAATGRASDSSHVIAVRVVAAACASATLGVVAIASLRNQAAILLCGLFCGCSIAFAYHARGFRTWRLLLTVLIAVTVVFAVAMLALPFVFSKTVTVYK